MNNNDIYFHSELYKDLQYEINKIKENINTVKLFLHDMEKENIKETTYIKKYCDQMSDLENLLTKKNDLICEVKNYLLDNCEHDWVKDFSESCLYTNVKVNPFKTCKKCGIMIKI